ncbi:MAG: hypothetical protein JJU29_01110 [Verrucomicrobia bacterium]|nr:hypothetical protein [Verrucomicrobiota bacterium]MCH8510494.1 hypothetical protein [Kiritimatiellia bacterium]
MKRQDKTKGNVIEYKGGKIRIRPNGSFAADLHVGGGKRRRKQCDNLDAAKAFIDKEQAARDNHGLLAVALTPRQLQECADAIHLLQDGGLDVSLVTVASEYLRRNRPNQINLTVGEAFERYMDHVKRRGGKKNRPARQHTLDSKRKRLGSFIELYGETNLRDITESDVQNWMESLGEVQERTRFNRKSELQSFLNGCQKFLDIDYVNDVCRVEQPGENEQPAAIITPQHAAGMMKWLEENKEPKFIAAMALMFFGGIRPMEILRHDNPLTWETIDFEKGEIYVPAPTSKTRTHRTIEIQNNLKAWLKRYRGEGRIGPVESSFRAARTSAYRSAGLDSWPMDAARHSFATYAGIIYGSHKAASWMGHGGTLYVFDQHYKGLGTRKDAEAFFKITPARAAGNLIRMEATA